MKIKKLTGVFLALFIMFTMSGCNSSATLSIPEGVLDFDLKKMNSEDQGKHAALVKLFKTMNKETTIAYGTTSTANMFSQLGLNVSAAPESSSLDKGLTKQQVNIKAYQKHKNILNIGSAIKLNMEAIIKIKPDYFVYSDAMQAMGGVNYDELVNNGIKVIAIPQSNYKDMFILLDALKEAGINNSKVDNIINTYNSDLNKIKDILKNKKADHKVALVQAEGASMMSMGSDAMLGKVAKSLGMNNIFANSGSSALNKEKLIQDNPQVFFYYSYDNNPKDTSVLDALQKVEYQNIDAIKNKKVIRMGNDSYIFSPSVDLNITKVMLQLVQNTYE